MYFGVKRLLGYSTDMFWTSSPRNIGKCPRKTHVLTSQFKEIVSKTIILFDGMDNRKCLRWGEHIFKDQVRILVVWPFLFILLMRLWERSIPNITNYERTEEYSC